MKTYRENLIAQLEEEKHNTEKAIETFFDSKKSKKQRLEAFEVSGTFITELDIVKALSVFRDETEDVEIRAAAILGLISYAASSEEFINELLDLLNNESVPNKMKEAALSVLQSSTFGSPILNSKRPEYNNALRNLVESDCPQNLKLRATEYLAIEKDEYIQSKLLDSLENPKGAFIKPEVAIQLLSYDLHSDAYNVLKKIAKDPPNKSAKKEAIRSLSADPDSAELLQKVLEDKDEDKEIRHVAATGLQSIKPELLQNSLKDILIDKNENEELRVALLNTLNYTENTENIDNDDAFQAKLEDIKNSSNSKNLKKIHNFYLENKPKK
ncbi:MAG TPA: HEAT repeat domain-containing protein [Pyrinomonadaceae bacterium]|jgi:hypothetical protein